MREFDQDYIDKKVRLFRKILTMCKSIQGKNQYDLFPKSRLFGANHFDQKGFCTDYNQYNAYVLFFCHWCF